MSIALSLFALFGSSADASVLWGNPTPKITVIQGPASHVDVVNLYHCSGQADQIEVDKQVSTTSSTNITVASTNFCEIEVVVQWGGSGPFEAVEVGNLGVFKATLGAATLDIELDAINKTAKLL